MRTRIWWWERVAGLAVAGLAAVVYLSGGFERVELISYDWRARWSATPPDDRTIVVAIDNPSLKELGVWPLPRGLHAQLVDTLAAARAKVIAFDIDFSTKREARDDARFTRAVARSGRVVTAAFHETRDLGNGATVEYANLPYPELAAASHGVGSINLPVDQDGALRRSPVSADVLGNRGWSFAVETVRSFLDVSPGEIRLDANTLWIGTRPVQMGDGLDSYIRFFGGPATFRSVSYADVIRGRVDPALFRDKIVLVGATSLELQDLRHTPFEGLMAGVEIQANAIETLLSGSGYRRTTPRQVLIGVAAIVIAWSLLIGLLVGRQRDTARRLRVIGVLGAAMLIAIVAVAWSAFGRLIFVDLVPWVAAGAGQVATSFIAGYWLAERRVEFQSENLLALYTMGEAARHRTTLERLADLLFAQTRHLLAVDRLGVDLWDETAHRFTERLVKDDSGFHPPLPLESYEPIMRRVFSTSAPTAIPEFSNTLYAQGLAGPRFRSSLFLPMVAQNRIIGGLHVHRHRAVPFTEDEAKTLLTLATQVALNIENGQLLDEVRTLFRRSLEAFSTALDFKDNDTGGHSQRVSLYAIEVARRMAIGPDQLDVIGQGALLHDIGKIAVPDRILLKPGQLSEAEWAIMRKHPETGYQMLKTIQIPEPIALIVHHHHERFDGGGYPRGLRGDQITLGARIFSVADLYDAMTSDRPYRKALSIDRVVAELKRVAGTQLDPVVVEAFLGIPDRVLAQLRATVHSKPNEGRVA